MTGPTGNVWRREDVDDDSPLSPDCDPDGVVCKELPERGQDADDDVSDSGSEPAQTGTLSQGFDNWCMADVTWNPGELHEQRLPVEELKKSPSRGESLEKAKAGGIADDFLCAVGDAAATAAAAAAAANAVAAQQRLEQQEQREQLRRSQEEMEMEMEMEIRESGGRRPATEAEVEPAEQYQLGAPPGLDLDLASPSLPSRGSGMHCSGDCSPCVWHWKPQGCFRGRECGYCHLCPEGEIKMRKKAKLATLRSGSRGLESSPLAEAGEEDQDPDQDQDQDQDPDLDQEEEKEKEKGKGKGKEKEKEKEKGDAAEQRESRPRTAQQQPEAGSLGSPCQMPSFGSALHATGECRPCAWFWKPQGCQNGHECRHCHLCPEGEIKSRKKQKVETMRKDQLEEDLFNREESAGGQETPGTKWPLQKQTPHSSSDSGRSLSIPPPPGLGLAEDPAHAPEPTHAVAGEEEVDKEKLEKLERPEASPERVRELPSVGSLIHGTGECRPCAWFWKAQGCQNGRECRHCHLCPEGEIKARKKEKAENLRQERQQLELDLQLELEQPGEQPSPAGQQLQLDDGLEPLDLTDLTQGQNQSCAPPTLPFLPLVPPPLPSLPSIGSSLHGTGLCRPCAWFWKPQGCENGQECCHCHLCPNGEIKARRKMKVAVLRHQGSLQEQLELQEEMGQWEAWEVQGHTPQGFFQEEASPESDASPAFSEATGQSPFSPPVPLDLSSSLDSPLPSTGSALHSLGKCRPCAWFWKTTGCLNGQACAHCHLCPEGELKVRKKVKETAMRIGALMPARGMDSRSPRVVKIAPVLGA